MGLSKAPECKVGEGSRGLRGLGRLSGTAYELGDVAQVTE